MTELFQVAQTIDFGELLEFVLTCIAITTYVVVGGGAAVWLLVAVGKAIARLPVIGKAVSRMVEVLW